MSNMFATTDIAIAAASAATPPSHFERLRNRLAALTAALIAVPALINAGYDIYAAALKLPRSESERLNVELFKKYIHKEPAIVFPIPIKSALGVLDATFYVYDEGDIHIEYGGQTQWFTLPKPSVERRSEFSILPSAYAAPIVIRPTARLVPNQLLSQHSVLNGSTLLRTRLYQDGLLHQDEIDVRTGAILRTSTAPAPKSLFPLPKAPSQITLGDGIDLRKLLSESAASSPIEVPPLK